LSNLVGRSLGVARTVVRIEILNKCAFFLQFLDLYTRPKG